MHDAWWSRPTQMCRSVSNSSRGSRKAARTTVDLTILFIAITTRLLDSRIMSLIERRLGVCHGRRSVSRRLLVIIIWSYFFTTFLSLLSIEWFLQVTRTLCRCHKMVWFLHPTTASSNSLIYVFLILMLIQVTAYYIKFKPVRLKRAAQEQQWSALMPL